MHTRAVQNGCLAAGWGACHQLLVNSLGQVCRIWLLAFAEFGCWRVMRTAICGGQQQAVWPGVGACVSILIVVSVRGELWPEGLHWFGQGIEHCHG